jgi:plasmid stabilization system protein ParE
MKTLVISEKAYDDLLGILRYIARDRPNVAARFVDTLEQQCEFLARCPESGTKRDDLGESLRVFSFRGYGIYFRNLPDRVRIERVLPPGLVVSKHHLADRIGLRGFLTENGVPSVVLRHRPCL